MTTGSSTRCCGLCHTSDTEFLGWATRRAPGDSIRRRHSAPFDCAVCHAYTGRWNLTLQLVRQLIPARDQWHGRSPAPTVTLTRGDNHGDYEHPVEVGPNDLSYDPPGQLCSACHVVADWTEIETIEHNVPTNGAGSCSTCHNSSRTDVVRRHRERRRSIRSAVWIAMRTSPQLTAMSTMWPSDT